MVGLRLRLTPRHWIITERRQPVQPSPHAWRSRGPVTMIPRESSPAPMSQTMTTTSRIAAIRNKVEAGQRLSFDDGLFLYEDADLFTLGELANQVRERKNGNFTYY